MATSPETAAFLVGQMAGAGASLRKMFGEYAVYCDGKVVALVCDDELFVKPTPGALALVGTATMAPPYPGAKPHLLIRDEIDDPEAFARLLRAVAQDLPPPKPKTPRKTKT